MKRLLFLSALFIGCLIQGIAQPAYIPSRAPLRQNPRFQKLTAKK